MSQFSEFVKSAPPTKPQLPLVHTCDAFHFRDIIAKRELTPAPCSIFKKGESLVYFFYGRPSYRPSETDQATSNPAFMPVSIVLDPKAINDPKRIAPFDTGAFSERLFNEHMHPKMSLDDFLLEASMDMPARLVSKFFESNIGYFRGKPAIVDIPPSEFEAVSYNSLINSSGSAAYDDRASAIEIQTECPVTLTEKNVILVVLPGPFMDERKYRDLITVEWRADVCTYAMHRFNPKEYTSLFYQNIEAFYQKKRYL